MTVNKVKISSGMPELEQKLDFLSDRIDSLQMFLSEILGSLPFNGEPKFFPETARLDADEYISVTQGVYELEYDDDGQPYRWTGPSAQFHFWMAVDTSQAKHVDLWCSGAVKEGLLDEISVIVNGATVSHDVVYEGGMSIVRIHLPPRTTPFSLPLKISYNVGQTFSPSELGASQDERKLGLIFRSIEIKNA